MGPFCRSRELNTDGGGGDERETEGHLAKSEDLGGRDRRPADPHEVQDDDHRDGDRSDHHVGFDDRGGSCHAEREELEAVAGAAAG